MTLLIQGLVSSLSVGAIYALLALSYSLIFMTMRVAHFAQGDIFMIGMLLAFELFVTRQMNFVAMIVVTVALTIFVMLVIEKFFYRPMFNGPPIYLFMCTIGMSIFLRSFAQLIFGNETFAFPTVFGDTAVRLGPGIAIVPQNIAIIVASLILMVALVIFTKKTKMGKAMYAVSMNKDAASLMGIKFTRIIVITYAIAAGLSAIAGIFTAPIFLVNATVGVIGLRALVAAILGGFGNIYGAILGGLLLGIIETMGSLYISSAYRDTISFGILIVVLIFRPQGILGQTRITKV